MSARNWGLLLLLALLWGSSFFFYKILVAVLPPVTVVLGRVGIAAVAMNLWLLAQGRMMPRAPRLWRRFLVQGFINNVLPFTLIAWGETRISSGLASILNATMPIFMVVIAHWGTQDEKLTTGKAVGIDCGILGVAVLAGAEAFRGGAYIWGALAVVGASCVYAFGGIYNRRFDDLAPLQAATGQVTGATVLMVPLSLVIDRPWGLAWPDLNIWASLLAIALINTAMAYVVYYKMLASAGVTYISLVTFLIPIVALLLGGIFLHEPVGASALAGMAIIAVGLAAADSGRLASILRGTK